MNSYTGVWRPSFPDSMTTIPSHTQRLTSDLLNRFSSIVGHRNVVTDPDEQRPYLLGSSRHPFPAWSPAILIPQTVSQVVSILKLASETAISACDAGWEYRIGRGAASPQRRARSLTSSNESHP